MADKYNYNINLDVKYNPLELIDVPSIVETCAEKWFNQTLTKVNSSVVRLGIVKGEFHWHKHDNDDEFFFVLEGKLIVDIEGSSMELNPGQGVTVPMGVMHKTRAPQKTVMLMVGNCEIQPTGD